MLRAPPIDLLKKHLPGQGKEIARYSQLHEKRDAKTELKYHDLGRRLFRPAADNVARKADKIRKLSQKTHTSWTTLPPLERDLKTLNEWLQHHRNEHVIEFHYRCAGKLFPVSLQTPAISVLKRIP